ncbi:MAG: polysaccharide biosynthesis tyrosine autokinase [Planctomycetes bacterium]|jgi:capsular exopolysaccharide synthesis family protein|nr:polysaccharide biosynthesis tyrosine autokinase [Planctomycetota bacterium]
MGNVSNAMKKQEPESQHSLHVRVPLPSQTPAPAPDSEEPPKTRLAVLLPKNRPSQASPPRPEVAKPAERASTVAQAVGKSPAQPKQRPVVSRNAKYAEVIIAHHSQNHEITEQYRTLCARLLAGGAGKLSLMITSADAGEGKTVTCLNLAIVLAARQENRVVVVDCDFRKKQVAQMLNCRKGPGFAEVLDGTSRVSEAIQSSAYPNLSILTAGYTRGRNAGELLAQMEVEDVIRDLRCQYEYVLLDTPPINLVSDAAAIGRVADQALLVVRMHKTRRESVANAIKALEATNIKIGGLVLTHQKSLIPSYIYKCS